MKQYNIAFYLGHMLGIYKFSCINKQKPIDYVHIQGKREHVTSERMTWKFLNFYEVTSYIFHISWFLKESNRPFFLIKFKWNLTFWIKTKISHNSENKKKIIK